MTNERPARTFAVIPAFRARKTLRDVVEQALVVVDTVIVVDDACPDRCGDAIDELVDGARVHLIRREKNGGVGAAMKTGIAEALRLDAEIIVKIDADGQMDTRYVPHMIQFLRDQPEVDLIKGNRFMDPDTLRKMPIGRLIGNAGLTFLVKFSSGYWTLVDPTNGFLGLRASALRGTDLARLADRYFFEIDLLCAFGLRRRAIAEMEMPSIYGDERSSLSIRQVLLTFPIHLLSRFIRRIVLNYLIIEINFGSICALIGFPLWVASIVFGIYQWNLSYVSGQPRATGTVMLALLLFMLGFQLLIQALFYDVQFSTRTLKVRRDPDKPPVMARGGSEVFFRS
jgi:glycosyltransferase involved in cell wall biosynthesis